MNKKINFQQLTNLDNKWIRSKISEFIKEDAPHGDLTTKATVLDSTNITANMIAMEDLIFCGEKYLPFCFPDDCKIEYLASDGEAFSSSEVLLRLSGPAKVILTYERVVLNLVQRLCGISSETNKYCNLNLPEGFKVMDTRKTTPGIRKFEKHAVSVGGGWNHRLDLSSAILIKDNHIQAAGGITNAIKQSQAINENKIPIELEVDTIDQLKEGLLFDIDGFLLDNMDPLTVEKCVQLIRKKEQGHLLFIEASGGINYNTLESFAWTGIDGVSMSAITANAPPVDIKLEFK